jgi:hypothetical protein
MTPISLTLTIMAAIILDGMLLAAAYFMPDQRATLIVASVGLATTVGAWLTKSPLP